jgi:hypothetical protein
MPTWVRYSVAVYIGLLLAGAVVVPEPLAAAGGWLRLAEPDVDPNASLPADLDAHLAPHPLLHHVPPDLMPRAQR